MIILTQFVFAVHSFGESDIYESFESVTMNEIKADNQNVGDCKMDSLGI